MYKDYKIEKFDAGVTVKSDIPSVDREFRAFYVTTVLNLDWPSAKGLSELEQKAEVQMILDSAEDLNLNAVIFQVRGAGEAFYASSKEPWSQYLSGRVGIDPGYDPLQYWIDETHKRGMLLHAWVNPYRAGLQTDTTDTLIFNSLSPAKNSSLDVKDLTSVGKPNLWLNPADSATEDYVVGIIEDIMSYNVDGLVMDDYFYPYLEGYSDDDRTTQFPDTSIWAETISSSIIEENRRSVITAFIERVYRLIKDTNEDALFGISPFGLYSPGEPVGTDGTDAYKVLACDTKRWLQDGLVDYMAPQLYWPNDYPIYSNNNPIGYNNLLMWWSNPKTNSLTRHIWPALTQYYVSWNAKNTEKSFLDRAKEFSEQIAFERSITATDGDTTGYLFFRAKMLMENSFYTDNSYIPIDDSGHITDITNALKALQPKKALIPATPWRSSIIPDAPVLMTEVVNGELNAKFMAIDSAEFYVVYIKSLSTKNWSAHITKGIKADGYNLKIPNASNISKIIVTSVTTLGIESTQRVIIEP